MADHSKKCGDWQAHDAYQQSASVRFCPNCGEPVTPGEPFVEPVRPSIRDRIDRVMFASVPASSVVATAVIVVGLIAVTIMAVWRGRSSG